jgi:hypothetical protein
LLYWIQGGEFHEILKIDTFGNTGRSDAFFFHNKLPFDLCKINGTKTFKNKVANYSMPF